MWIRWTQTHLTFTHSQPSSDNLHPRSQGTILTPEHHGPQVWQDGDSSYGHCAPQLLFLQTISPGEPPE